jgi:hypothetical protein
MKPLMRMPDGVYFLRIPDGDPGDQLVFPAIQVYRSGKRVAWTGGPDAVQPAARLTLTAPARAGSLP